MVDPTIRPRLHDFFARALQAEAAERFDTAEEMLLAWRQVFAMAAQPAVPQPAVIAAGAPRANVVEPAEHDDSCGVGKGAGTPDDQLPAARGGVA